MLFSYSYIITIFKIKDDSTDATQVAGVRCKPAGVYSLEDQTDCGSYYSCENGTAAKMSCPQNELFNLEISKCEEAKKVFCDQRPVLNVITVKDPCIKTANFNFD